MTTQVVHSLNYPHSEEGAGCMRIHAY